MTSPPLVVGLCLALWGWQVGQPVFGLIMGALLEGSRLTGRRWDLSAKDFQRISDFSAVVFILFNVYRWLEKTKTTARWFPVILFPLMLAQAYSSRQRVHLGALFWTYRKKSTLAEMSSPPEADLTFPFLLMTLIAAGADDKNVWFFPVMFLLAAAALWPFRSKRVPAAVWALLLLAVGGAGYAGQVGLNRLHVFIEERAGSMFLARGENPYQNVTSLGDVQSFKSSDRILFRVESEAGPTESYLLRKSSYNTYGRATWYARGVWFKGLSPGRSGDSWSFGPAPEADRTVRVVERLEGGQALLKMPLGAHLVENLPVVLAQRNQFGAVKVTEGPGLLRYLVHYGPTRPLDAPPDEADLEVPEDEKAAAAEIARTLGLKETPPERAVKVVEKYFREKFIYSLNPGEEKRPEGVTPLEFFLTTTRRGHCEYFATAAALVLRAAGIRTRYATGYFVKEYSELEQRFVVRSRHAHAWTLVHYDDSWRDLDATPPDWFASESQAASSWQPLRDWTSWLLIKYSEWRWSENRSALGRYVWWLLIPLGLLLAYRLRGRKRGAESGPADDETGPVSERPGLESSFYLVETRLREEGYVRNPWETMASFLDRVEAAGRPTRDLRPLLDLHNKLRFDPAGLARPERRALEEGVEAWLERPG